MNIVRGAGPRTGFGGSKGPANGLKAPLGAACREGSQGVKNIIIKGLAAVPALALTAGTVLAQDFTAGKTPAQLFASDCSACHRSPDGLGKKYNAGSLTGFLRAHYTTKQESAGALAKYVMGFATMRAVATTSPTAEDARSPDGKHRSDVSSDGEKKPRAKPAAANEDHPPVPQPAQPAPAEAAVHPPAPVPAPAPSPRPARATAAESEGTTKPKPNTRAAAPAAPPQVAAPAVQQVAAPAAPQPDSAARVQGYAISGAGAEETAAEAPKLAPGKSHRRADAEAAPNLPPAETGEPAAAEIVTGSTPEPAAAAPDAAEKSADAPNK
jgi:hypothetical protein